MFLRHVILTRGCSVLPGNVWGLLIISNIVIKKILWKLKSGSCQNRNFASDDKFGIMTTLAFQCVTYCIYQICHHWQSCDFDNSIMTTLAFQCVTYCIYNRWRIGMRELSLCQICRHWQSCDFDNKQYIASPSVGRRRVNLGLRPACERRRYFVTTSLIGGAQT